jgi:hypothetical protein
LFSSEHDHFRRWIRLAPDGERIYRDLPGKSASLNELVDSAVDNLQRQGFLDSSFFDRLKSEFPRRSLDIDGVARQWR